MTAVLIIADCGQRLASISERVAAVPGLFVLRHVNGHASVGRLVAALAPDLVLIDEMRWHGLALTRLDETRRAAPAARIVLIAAGTEASWLANALAAGADAVLPATVDAATLGCVVGEVLEPFHHRIAA